MSVPISASRISAARWLTPGIVSRSVTSASQEGAHLLSDFAAEARNRVVQVVDVAQVLGQHERLSGVPPVSWTRLPHVTPVGGVVTSCS
jgi:hypothetical protein